MKRLLLTTSAAAMILTGPVMAQSLVDRLVAEYKALGYSFVEIYEGPSQIKVEATQGNQTLEVVYAAATGDILYTDLDLADLDEMLRTGVEFNRESRDFVRVRGSSDDRSASAAASDAPAPAAPVGSSSTMGAVSHGHWDDNDYDDYDDDWDDHDDWGSDDWDDDDDDYDDDYDDD
jgi:hypothetical protein